MLSKIVSGGQTGVDRAALDVALGLGIPCGGWCPKGRWAEDGPIDPRYPLAETPSAEPSQRTEWNVRDSDGTLILLAGQAAQGGTRLTIASAERLGKPCLVVDLASQPDVAAVRDWAERHGVRTLNVAGPRQSESAGLYEHALAFLRSLLGSPGSATTPS